MAAVIGIAVGVVAAVIVVVLVIIIVLIMFFTGGIIIQCNYEPKLLYILMFCIIFSTLLW